MLNWIFVPAGVGAHRHFVSVDDSVQGLFPTRIIWHHGRFGIGTFQHMDFLACRNVYRISSYSFHSFLNLEI